MVVWKEIPAWFKLSNYESSTSFTSVQWAYEVGMRQKHFDTRFNSTKSILGTPEEKDVPQFFDDIKNNGLYSKVKPVGTSFLAYYTDAFEGERPDKGFAVRDISKFTAYSFLVMSSEREEFEHDFSIAEAKFDYPHLVEDQGAASALFYNRYSVPVADTIRKAYLEIDMTASDKQVISEFTGWLKKQRASSSEFAEKYYSGADFKKWHSSRLLPYWDLISIAKLENASIPNHIMGAALFPDEFGVDLAERIRKVTEKGCNNLFSQAVYRALRIQARAESLMANKS